MANGLHLFIWLTAAGMLKHLHTCPCPRACDPTLALSPRPRSPTTRETWRVQGPSRGPVTHRWLALAERPHKLTWSLVNGTPVFINLNDIPLALVSVSVTSAPPGVVHLRPGGDRNYMPDCHTSVSQLTFLA